APADATKPHDGRKVKRAPPLNNAEHEAGRNKNLRAEPHARSVRATVRLPPRPPEKAAPRSRKDVVSDPRHRPRDSHGQYSRQDWCRIADPGNPGTSGPSGVLSLAIL